MTTSKPRKLSPAQIAFLTDCLAGPSRTPFTGGRNAGRIASAWYRTAQALEDRGLVVTRRTGDARTAEITEAGRQAIGGQPPIDAAGR